MDPAVSICDLDFADEIVLLSNEIEQAKMLFHSVEVECSKIGLGMNAKKTKGMTFNVDFVEAGPADWNSSNGRSKSSNGRCYITILNCNIN